MEQTVITFLEKSQYSQMKISIELDESNWGFVLQFETVFLVDFQ